MIPKSAAPIRIGDKVRVIAVPPYLYSDDPVAQETAEFFERCLGKVFRVEGFDNLGQLELWTTGKGNRRKTARGLDTRTIWIEPEYVKPFAQQYPARRGRL